MDNKRPAILKRSGYFQVDIDFIRSHIVTMQLIMSKVIIVDARANLADNRITYYGYSHLFDEIEKGQQSPGYSIGTNQTNGKLEAERIDA